MLSSHMVAQIININMNGMHYFSVSNKDCDGRKYKY